MKPTILVALGSNLGDSADIVRGAMAWLETVSTGPILRSSLWTSTPVDCPPGSPVFVNAAVALELAEGERPEAFLIRLQEAERTAGRRPKKVLNEARPLDLDLIAWGGLRMATPFLTLPHPRAHERRFVLQPLAEVAPDFQLPGIGRTVAEVLATLPPDPNMRVLEARGGAGRS